MATLPLSSTAPRIPEAEYQERRARVVAGAEARDLDGVLAWSMGGSTLDAYGDVFYLTNHYCPEPKAPDLPPHWTGFGSAAVVLPIGAPAALLVGPPNWRRDLVAVDEVHVDRDLYSLVVRQLREKGLATGRLGFVRQQTFPLPLYQKLCSDLPSLELVAVDDVLDDLRMIKSRAEIDLMRHAQSVSVEIMAAMMEEVAVGKTDGDVAALGFAVATRLGATPYEFAMASGPHADHAYYHRLPTFDPRRRYEVGDFVHPDAYGCVDGYFYDFVRSTIVGGRPDREQLEVSEGAIAAVHFICDQLRPGRRACDVHQEASRWMREEGWRRDSGGPQLTDFSTFEAYGHGIGCGWEPPWITSTDETVLTPGMTIAIETSVTREGVGTALYEETVLVTDEEPEIMTAACSPTPWV